MYERIIEERMFDFHERPNVQTQLKEYIREVFASQHGGQSMVMIFIVRILILQWAKRVRKEEDG